MIELRRWTAADAPALVDAYADPVLRAFSRWHCTTTAEALAWIAMHDEGWAAGTRYGFAVVEEAHVAGTVALKRTEPGGPRGEAGYWTVASARGRGIAPQAVSVLTEWAFATFPELTAIDLFHRLDNTASCRVASKAGYPLAETLPPEAPGRDGGHRHTRGRDDVTR